jgi:HlyD family secretion protein
MAADTTPLLPSDHENSVSPNGRNLTPAGSHFFVSRPIPIWYLAAGVAAIVLVAALVFFRHAKVPQTTAAPAASPRAVACLGRIEPEDGVRVIGARSLSGQPSLVGEVEVREGDFVRAQQILALLNSKDELEAVVRQAHANVDLARKRLAQVKAGAKAGDIAAQKSEVARIQVELENAQVEYARTQALYEEKVGSKSTLDLRRVEVESKARLLDQATERLRSVSEVRSSDVSVAEADVAVAVAQEQRARAEYEASIVRAPISGQVVKIHARPGEEVGPKGIMELGHTDRMYVIAEVPDTQIGFVQPGHHAVVTIDGLSSQLSGTVQQIGSEVGKNELIYTDAAALSDARVLEVKILLDDGKSAARLIHAQARVLIKP